MSDFNTSAGAPVEFAASGGSARAFQVLASSPEAPWLFVFHEFLGLTDYIRREACVWQEELDVNVLALDLFDGVVGSTREEGLALVTSASPERLNAIIDGALDYIGRRTAVSMLGWCFGGAWALRAAIRAGDQCRSTLMYYGMPVFNVDELRELHGPVIEIFGSEDAHINQDVQHRFEAAMREAGRELKTYTFPAGHAFANPSNPQHDIDSTEKARQISLDFLQRTLL